jgi:O-antigen ligase
VCALAIWALFAFGGVYLRTEILVAIATALLAAIVRPSVMSGASRALDLWLLAFLGLSILQVVPVPRSIAGAIVPASVRLGRELTLGADARFTTLSIRPADTLQALIVLATALAVFWMARETYRTGGVRTSVRAIALAGFVVSLIALAQSATARGLMYWRWRPTYEGPEPFGPFVNRNHFATWAVLAIPVCLGYLAARSYGRDRRDPLRPLRARVAHAIDARAMWLTASAVALLAALAVTLSRSGIAALGAALAFAWWLTRGRGGRLGRRVAVAAAIAAAGAIALWNAPALAGRFARTAVGYADRVIIWRETLPIVRDFWTTGAGLGTFESAMAFYQQTDRSVFFNQAHSEYLQLAAEGGLLLLAGAAGATIAFLRLAAVRLREDPTGVFWIRAGAAAGLAAAALQSVWENGLRIPANALLAAILAAIVVHEPHNHHTPPP